MAMTSSRGVSAVCCALITAIGVALGISGAAADDLAGSEQIGASDAGGAASMATEVDGRRLWSRQPGTSSPDRADGVATDKDGNVYVVGSTFGALGGAYKGSGDAWVIKFDGDGRRLWSRQPGTSSTDFAGGVATDKDGNVYVVGTTFGALGGAYKGGADGWVINKFDADGWVMKFDGGGRRLWSRQPATSSGDSAEDVATDTDGNVYVVGVTEGALGGANKGEGDAWVIKFDGDGRRLWSRQPGTSDLDFANRVVTDRDGNVYVVGETFGALGGAFKGEIDGWVIKYDGDGRRLWSQQPGTSNADFANGVATDRDGNVYVVGYTFGALGGAYKGSGDAWVIKFDGNGHPLWTRQPGTSSFDRAFGVATDTEGNVSVAGDTEGSLGGPHKGGSDAWVIKFDGNGRRLWSQQPGTSTDDVAFGVATDTNGNVSIVGDTDGALGGANKGGGDAWVIKYTR